MCSDQTLNAGAAPDGQCAPTGGTQLSQKLGSQLESTDVAAGVSSDSVALPIGEQWQQAYRARMSMSGMVPSPHLGSSLAACCLAHCYIP